MPQFLKTHKNIKPTRVMYIYIYIYISKPTQSSVGYLSYITVKFCLDVRFEL